MGRIGVGLIGAGKHGQRYARHIGEVEALVLVALCRRNTELGREQAGRLGCTYHASVEELVSDPKVEAVVAAVPPTVNPEIATCAARLGKPLLVEKPLAASIEEGRRIIDAFESSGLLCMVAHTLRFNQVVRAMKQRIGEIGRLHGLCLSQRFEPSPLDWLDRRRVSGGGIVIHTGVHSFDLLRYFTGAEAKTVLACTAQVATRETEDNFAALLFMEPGGIIATVVGSRATQGRSGYIELAGQLGQLVGDHVRGHASKVVGRNSYPFDPGPSVPTVKKALESFASCLQTGADPPVTLRDGLSAVAMAEACYRSAASGRAEPVETII